MMLYPPTDLMMVVTIDEQVYVVRDGFRVDNWKKYISWLLGSELKWSGDATIWVCRKPAMRSDWIYLYTCERKDGEMYMYEDEEMKDGSILKDILSRAIGSKPILGKAYSCDDLIELLSCM